MKITKMINSYCYVEMRIYKYEDICIFLNCNLYSDVQGKF